MTTPPEQYLLAAYLLGGGGKLEILLPNAFLSCDPHPTHTEAVGEPRDVARERRTWEDLLPRKFLLVRGQKRSALLEHFPENGLR
jgi:hypothetical protein